MQRVGVAPDDAPALAEIVIAARAAAPAGRRVDPSGERRRHRRSGDLRPARHVRRGVGGTARQPDHACDPRRQLGRRVGASVGSLLVRSGGDRDLRDLARARRRSSLPRAAPGDELAGQGRVSRSASKPGPGSRTGCGTRSRGRRPSPRFPIGYADGVPRRLFETGGEVLIGGRRRPIVGVVTMDQLMVDVGDDPVAVGDEVVLIGEQGGRTRQRRGVGRPARHDRLRDRVWREQAHRTFAAP